MFRRFRVGATLAARLVAVAASDALPTDRVLAAAGSAPRPVTAAWLEGVSATSGRNAWAVGAFGHANGAAELIEHWNGRKWTRRSSASPSRRTLITSQAFAATSAASAFAAGTLESQYAFPLIDQWDGTAWKQDQTPALGLGDCACAAVLTGVAATQGAPGRSANTWATPTGYSL